MKHPELSKATSTTYTGAQDGNGQPHGYGVMDYATAAGVEYRYEGTFLNGRRHGFATWYRREASGAYVEEYVGWWKDDEPHDLSIDKVEVADFEITPDNNFLKHFLDDRDVRILSPSMAEKLRCSTDPYGRYGYGRWLHRTQVDDENLKTALECFRYAADNGIADALQMLALMYYEGDVYDEEKGIFVMNRSLYHELNAQAEEQGSELAKLTRNYDLFYGNKGMTAHSEAALVEAEREAFTPGASLLWMEQLGWFYATKEWYNRATEAYIKCIDGGLLYPIFSIAVMSEQRGNIAYYESLMKEGISRDVPNCMILGSEKENEWDTLTEQEQRAIHEQLSIHLQRGVDKCNALCTFLLAGYTCWGVMGFEQDVEQGLKIAYRGVRCRDADCCALIATLLEDMDYAYDTSEQGPMKEKELLMMMLRALRYGSENMLSLVLKYGEGYGRIGYGDEIMQVWMPMWYETPECKELQEKLSKTRPAPSPRTPIPPTVLVIHPSGIVDFVEADVYPMSFGEMAALIGADGLDAVHFSTALDEITKECKLKKQVAMYVDKSGLMKGLDDNTVATLLYGNAYEIRGSVIIAMEDNRYDTHSFDVKEEVEGVYEAIARMTHGLARCK